MKVRLVSASVLALAGILAGCSGGSSDLPPDRDKALRSNLERPLTPEEIAQMGGGAGKDAPTSGVAIPDKK